MKHPDENVVQQPDESKHTVRCCSTKGDVCVSEPCHSDKTYQEAVAICSSKGFRLCFEHELNYCCGTGCGFDHTRNWIAYQEQGIY